MVQQARASITQKCTIQKKYWQTNTLHCGPKAIAESTL